MDVARFSAACESLGLTLSGAQLEAFARFEEALYTANARTNLTRVSREEAWLRHFVDSLLVQALLPEGASVLDLGTGPGFPAWPLACARPDLRITALDSAHKMTDFLRSQPLPNLEIVTNRAEDWQVRDRFDVVTGRAVAPLPILLELAAPAVREGGTLLPMRTPSEAELFWKPDYARVGIRLIEVREVPLPGSEIVRALPVYRKEQATPKRYPRRWAEIRKVPLG